MSGCRMTGGTAGATLRWSYARRTRCPGCGVPSMRKPNRRCRYCNTKACEDCIKKCCPKAIERKKAADEKMFNHFAAYYMRWMEDNRVWVHPYVAVGTTEVIEWHAKRVGEHTREYAVGASPLEALQNLADHKYKYTEE